MSNKRSHKKGKTKTPKQKLRPGLKRGEAVMEDDKRQVHTVRQSYQINANHTEISR